MLKVIDGQNQKKKVKVPELLKLLQIPAIEKVIYHDLETLKRQYHEDIQAIDKPPAVIESENTTDNILSINLAVLHSQSLSQNLKDYFRWIIDHPECHDVILGGRPRISV